MTTLGLIHALPASDRRVFNRAEAASYVSASVGYFDKLVRLGKMPKSLPLPRVRRWDKAALDRAVDVLSCIPDRVETPYETWSRTNGSS